MHLRLLGLFGALGVATAAALVACSPQNAGLISVTHVTPPSFVRVINGAPDVGQVDFTVVSLAPSPSPSPSAAPTATPSASPTPNPLATSLPYAQAAAYGAVTGDAGVHIVVKQHTSGTTVLTCTTPSVGEEQRFTIVIAGRGTSSGTATGLQCDMFVETPPTVATTSALIGMHHAAPAFAAMSTASHATVQFGTFPTNTTSYNKPLSYAGYQAPSNGNVVSETAAYATISAATAPGIGVYASDGTQATSGQTPTPPTPAQIFATLYPSQASVGYAIVTPGEDTNNVLPFQSPTTKVSTYLFDLYLIDSATTSSGAQLVGTLD
jgi:hypothetical protein